MRTVFDSIVKIYEDKELKGIGFIVKQEENISYVLTCNHVVYHSDKKNKRSIIIDDKKVENIDITYGHELSNNKVDLALIKVADLEGKVTISLQKEINENSLVELKTFAPVGNDEFSFDPTSIGFTYQDKEPLNYCHENSNAYLFGIDKPIQGGYSGSPVLDTATGKVVAILNIVRDKEEKSCRALSIDNISKIFPVIKNELKTATKKSSKITVLFKPSNTPNCYDVIVNNEDKFESLDIEKLNKQKEIIDYIFSLARVPNRKIEFFIPPELFEKNIHLWESSRKKTLIAKHSVYYRSWNLSQHTGDLKEYWIKKWDKDYEKYKDGLFFESISEIDEDKNFHPDIVSAVCKADTKFNEDDFRDLEDDYISIAIWNNECHEGHNFDNFVTKLKEGDFSDLSENFKGEVFKRKGCCSSFSSLMWDNPKDLPKKDFKNG